ncbi:hypothetical protein [Acinetobacter sp. NIPH 2699]|uniref:hypothetical protein n=1 Tax=Acinetobacter sp. NIPH 2699 TaxID=2923433 RepID=UPI001F4AD6F9|nr:hypothetical protein [Acinetobacter sp. NIPH 2699]MCH7335018.1 hypothetical protein [Acinetobacter sp. NIPH 2699]
MAKSTSPTFAYRLSVVYRFTFIFVLGFLAMMYLSLSLTTLFTYFINKAEAIFLAALISILFYLMFVILGFCFNSLIKLTWISLALVGLLFGLSVGLN